jgi:branched-chain amino acid transport system substrate-binding protein
MADKRDENREQDKGSSAGEGISRRDFLRLAGVAGAAVGMGAGLGGFVAACGGGTTTTSAAATTTTAGGATTTVSASAEGGRDIKVGFVVPKTGALASYTVPLPWMLDHWNTALANGVVCGDGKNHKIIVETVDSQSDSNRSAQVTGDLIQNSKVDVVFAAGTPDTANPSADQCEANGCPGIFGDVPMEPFFFGRGGTAEKPFKWTWAQAAGLDSLVGSWVEMWGQLSTNKKVGMFFANTADGAAFSDPKTGAVYWVGQGGYDITLPGLYAPGTEDFTSVISEFKKIGCEICCSIAVPADFTNFWKQAAQQGYQPKIMTCGLALLFEETVIAIGPSAQGVTCELTWHPSWPYKDALTGQTPQQLADDYEAKTGRQWSQPLKELAMMEWLVDALKRTANVDDKEAITKAIGSTKMMTSFGPIDLTAPVGSKEHPVLNCAPQPIAGGQWRKGTKWDFEIAYITSTYVPGSQPGLGVPLEPLKYS